MDFNCQTELYGYPWQVNLPAGENKLRFKGTELELEQFHFHSPSEHAFDGQRFSMEAHLVHRMSCPHLSSFLLCIKAQRYQSAIESDNQEMLDVLSMSDVLLN